MGPLCRPNPTHGGCSDPNEVSQLSPSEPQSVVTPRGFQGALMCAHLMCVHSRADYIPAPLTHGEFRTLSNLSDVKITPRFQSAAWALP